MEKIFSIVAAAMFVVACSAPEGNQNTKPTEAPTISEAPTQGEVVADTITYLVYVRPQNPADDIEVANLSHLQNDKLIDMIFESVYQHGAKAYDYITHKEYTIDDIKTREIEEEIYSRRNVSVIQFTERWCYDAANLSFDKKVLKIHIGYAVYDEDSIIVANRPGMVIDMKN